MAEYIDRDRFADKIREHLRCSNKGSVTEAAYAAMLQDLEGLPIVDVAPVVHGEWLESISMEPAFMGGFMPKRIYFCSKCGLREKWKWPYCHCGAKMDGGEKDAEVQA